MGGPGRFADLHQRTPPRSSELCDRIVPIVRRRCPLRHLLSAHDGRRVLLAGASNASGGRPAEPAQQPARPPLAADRLLRLLLRLLHGGDFALVHQRHLRNLPDRKNRKKEDQIEESDAQEDHRLPERNPPARRQTAAVHNRRPAEERRNRDDGKSEYFLGGD